MDENLAAPSGVAIWSFLCKFDRPRPLFCRDKIEKIRKKSPKCTENDQFRQIDFLTTAYFHSNYRPFDAELHAEFFELIYMFVRRFVLELLTKTRSKNSRRNFADPMASEKGHSQSSQINIFFQIWIKSTPFDAELRAKFFELTLMFATYFILELLMKNPSMTFHRIK